jgi:hypothetical protein
MQSSVTYTQGGCCVQQGKGVWAVASVCKCVLLCSPFDDNSTSQPRLRSLPPAPQWLKRLLGHDADTACCEDDNPSSYGSLPAGC